MKKVLYVLTENLSLGVIKSQVLSHVNLLEKKRIDNLIFGKILKLGKEFV